MPPVDRQACSSNTPPGYANFKRSWERNEYLDGPDSEPSNRFTDQYLHLTVQWATKFQALACAAQRTPFSSRPTFSQLCPDGFSIWPAQPVKAGYHSLPNHSATSDQGGPPDPVAERPMFAPSQNDSTSVTF